MIDPDIVERGVVALEKLLVLRETGYTLTSAKDWPMLLVLGSAWAIIIAAMWRDLKNSITSNRAEWTAAIRALKIEEEKEHNLMWRALRECQQDCCPRKSSTNKKE